MKTSRLALLLIALIIPAQFSIARENEEPKKEEQEKDDRERKKEAVRQFLKLKDTNNDKSVSREEFLAGEENQEAAKQKFDEYNKNGDRALTKKEIAAMLGL